MVDWQEALRRGGFLAVLGVAACAGASASEVATDSAGLFNYQGLERRGFCKNATTCIRRNKNSESRLRTFRRWKSPEVASR